ncbi:hypothetical protein BKA67DRAFT_537749 [Truncatella angustata]|uniref:Uncharacterized protein n=1 Tax=Truncatella angustata TaxID=152316 RepID=A0A9P8ZUP3_9PEZI|nr:uncharacterized protein BKA67DRAFT_537749 [Truncatella angustata]KAH6651899.1 hypothetical protein BKA67DRAFT_537749 [Truncatella angustata]
MSRPSSQQSSHPSSISSRHSKAPLPNASMVSHKGSRPSNAPYDRCSAHYEVREDDNFSQDEDLYEASLVPDDSCSSIDSPFRRSRLTQEHQYASHSQIMPSFMIQNEHLAQPIPTHPKHVPGHRGSQIPAEATGSKHRSAGHGDKDKTSSTRTRGSSKSSKAGSSTRLSSKIMGKYEVEIIKYKGNLALARRLVNKHR